MMKKSAPATDYPDRTAPPVPSRPAAPVHATYLLGAIGGEGVIEPLMDTLRLAEEFEGLELRAP